MITTMITMLCMYWRVMDQDMSCGWRIEAWFVNCFIIFGHTDLICKCICNFKCDTSFKTKINFLFWTKNFRNFEITLPRSGCSRYLKACRRPTLWLLSSHFGRMQEHPLRGKDIKHQSSIYLIKIDKT